MHLVSVNGIKPGFPIWFVVHDPHGLFFVTLVIFVLLQRFASRFSKSSVAFSAVQEVFRRGSNTSVIGISGQIHTHTFLSAWSERARQSKGQRERMTESRGQASGGGVWGPQWSPQRSKTG
jgi:hypothetical protein